MSLISDAFADLPSVDYITFYDSKFKTVKAFQFAGIKTTGIRIILSYNEISTIEPQAFEGWLIQILIKNFILFNEISLT